VYKRVGDSVSRDVACHVTRPICDCVGD